MVAKVSKDLDTENFHAYGLHIQTRAIYVGSHSSGHDDLESGTDHRMAEGLLKNLHILNSISSDPIKIYMNNPGGDDYHMYAMYDEIAASPSEVMIIGSGHVASAGAFVLQAARRRVLRPHCRVLIHYGSAPVTREAEILCDIYRNVIFSKMKEHRPKLTKASMHELLLQDTWFSANEAVSMGLADEVL